MVLNRWCETRLRIAARFGPLEARTRIDSSQPSIDYGFADGIGTVGFIDSVSQPFCATCDRLRLTAEGKLRNCLFGREEWDVRDLLRGEVRNSDDESVVEIVRACLAAKRAAHGIDADDFKPPERAMFQIGG